MTGGDERALSIDIEGHRAGAGSVATTPIGSNLPEGDVLIWSTQTIKAVVVDP